MILPKKKKKKVRDDGVFSRYFVSIAGLGSSLLALGQFGGGQPTKTLELPLSDGMRSFESKYIVSVNPEDPYLLIFRSSRNEGSACRDPWGRSI